MTVAVEQILRGSVTYASGDGTNPTAISLGTTVDPDKCLVTYQVEFESSSGTAARDFRHLWGYTLTSTTLDFIRTASSFASTVTIHWQIVEYASGATVQRGTIAGVDTGNDSVTLGSSVNTDRAVPFVAAKPASDEFYWQIRVSPQPDLSSTTLDFSDSALLQADDTGDLYWQVVEYEAGACNVQKFTMAAQVGSPYIQTATLGAAVDADASIVLGWAGGAQSGCRGFSTIEINGAGTTVTYTPLTFGGSQTLPARIGYVLEFEDGTTVERGTVALTASETTNTESLAGSPSNPWFVTPHSGLSETRITGSPETTYQSAIMSAFLLDDDESPTQITLSRYEHQSTPIEGSYQLVSHSTGSGVTEDDVAESVDVDDSLTASARLYEDQSDSAEIGDALTDRSTAYENVSESVAIDDSVTDAKLALEDVSESFAVDESPSDNATAYEDQSESIDSDDAASDNVSVSEDVSESSSHGDATSDSVSVSEDVSESSAHGDDLVDGAVAYEDISESADVGDVVQSSVPGEAYEKGSIEFNGAGGYVRNDANIPADTGTMTLCGWAKMLADRNAESCIVYMPRYSAGATDFALRTDSDGTSLRINANYGSNQSAAHTLVANEWVFLAVSVSADTATFYTASEGDTALTTVGSVGITGFVPERMIYGENEAGQWFDGRLCMWRSWDQALSESELLAEFQSRELVETTDALLSYPMTGGDIANALDDALDGDNDLTEYGSSITFSTDAPAFYYSENVSESVASGDAVSASSIVSADISESIDTSTAEDAAVRVLEDISDSVDAADAFVDNALMFVDVSESVGAGDAALDSAQVFDDVSESVAADDADTDSVSAFEDLSESVDADDTVTSNDPGVTEEDVSESVMLGDALTVTGGTEVVEEDSTPHTAPTGRRTPLVHMTYRGRSYVGPADQVQRAVENQARLDAEQEEAPRNKRGTRSRAYQRAETLPLSIDLVELPGVQASLVDPDALRAVEAELRRAYQISMRAALNDAMAAAEASARRAVIEQNNAIAMAAAERLLLG